MGFDRYMEMALYTPALGYYARNADMLSATGQSGDFVTAPELSPLLGWALARQVAQALTATGTREVWEFGAGSGALAVQLLRTLDELGTTVVRYTIVDLSPALRQRQQATLAAYADRVRWVDALPNTLRGVIVGNEVLDAMPVRLLARCNGQWQERGVGLDANGAGFAWADRPTLLRPPIPIDGGHDYLTEVHPQAQAWVRTVGERLEAGALFLIDYGFPQSEYYHPQRSTGTVACHRAQRVDFDPLQDVGDKDLSAHVDFSGIAEAATDVGLELLGYCSQAHFLLNCGAAQWLERCDRAARIRAQTLLWEHEMGELFKVIGCTQGPAWEAMGFAQGDRTGML
ncbi:hypothetical protein Cenrod_0573 [Candidatus Symbiobacter mobilis CR]|uniref:SAM-dependent methyltransferase n=2 Tax=Candidatus Symbiobacter TaxID=1436289 RepID=U5N5X7_9BURK|nr:hypothetical protein Cenrod_0573 [Candidatus Symbiobacter mobilis CR]